MKNMKVKSGLFLVLIGFFLGFNPSDSHACEKGDARLYLCEANAPMSIPGTPFGAPYEIHVCSGSSSNEGVYLYHWVKETSQTSEHIIKEACKNLRSFSDSSNMFCRTEYDKEKDDLPVDIISEFHIDSQGKGSKKLISPNDKALQEETAKQTFSCQKSK